MRTTTPTLRLLPAPAFEPPYDDEDTSTPPVHGNLAIAFPHPARTVPLRLVPPAMADDDEPIPTPRKDLPDPRPWTRRLAQAVVEVLAGARAPGQLARYASLEVLDDLERDAGRLGRETSRGAVLRPVVASVHVSEPADGVAEACAVVDTGSRRRALALRLEGLDGRWRCTRLQFG